MIGFGCGLGDPKTTERCRGANCSLHCIVLSKTELSFFLGGERNPLIMFPNELMNNSKTFRTYFFKHKKNIKKICVPLMYTS